MPIPALAEDAAAYGAPLLQVEDFSEFGNGTKSAGHGIEGGTTSYRELSPRAGPEKER
jgi:hypothetical protein